MGESPNKLMSHTIIEEGILPAVGIGLVASLMSISVVLISSRGVGGSDISLPLVLGLGFLGLLAAVLLPPIVPLMLTLIFLGSPLPQVLDNRPSAYITSGLLAWAALGSFVSVSRPRNTVPHPLVGKVWLFAVYGLVSAARGILAGNPAEYILGDFFQVEEFAIVFILVTRLAVDGKSSRRLLGCALVSTFSTMLWQLALYAAGVDLGGILFLWEGTGSGAALRTINLGAIFVFGTLLSLYVALKSFRHRLLMWLLLIPTMANLVLSLTRGVWVASLVVVLVCAWLFTSNERTKLLKGMALVALCVAISASAWSMVGGATNAGVFDAVKERVSFALVQLQQGSQGTVAVETRRFVEVTTIAGQILPSPFFGKGLGALFSIDAAALLNRDAEEMIDYHYIHNLYLLVTFRMGLIGLAIFCWILYSYFRKALTVYAKLPLGPSRALTGGLIAGLAGQAVLSLTSPTILNHPTCALAACAMALTFRLRGSEADPESGLASTMLPRESAKEQRDTGTSFQAD